MHYASASYKKIPSVQLFILRLGLVGNGHVTWRGEEGGGGACTMGGASGVRLTIEYLLCNSGK